MVGPTQIQCCIKMVPCSTENTILLLYLFTKSFYASCQFSWLCFIVLKNVCCRFMFFWRGHSTFNDGYWLIHLTLVISYQADWCHEVPGPAVPWCPTAGPSAGRWCASQRSAPAQRRHTLYYSENSKNGYVSVLLSKEFLNLRLMGEGMNPHKASLCRDGAGSNIRWLQSKAWTTIWPLAVLMWTDLMVPGGVTTLLQPLCQALHQLQICCHHLPPTHMFETWAPSQPGQNVKNWNTCSTLTSPVWLCSSTLQIDFRPSTTASWSGFSVGERASSITSLDLSASSSPSLPSPSTRNRKIIMLSHLVRLAVE